jgi:hypothetical protein
MVAQGTILDMAGRPTDATITVSGANGTIGWVRSTAGRFSLFDLPQGTYRVDLRSARGTTSTASLTVAPGVSRPVLRVP